MELGGFRQRAGVRFGAAPLGIGRADGAGEVAVAVLAVDLQDAHRVALGVEDGGELGRRQQGRPAVGRGGEWRERRRERRGRRRGRWDARMMGPPGFLPRHRRAAGGRKSSRTAGCPRFQALGAAGAAGRTFARAPQRREGGPPGRASANAASLRRRFGRNGGLFRRGAGAHRLEPAHRVGDADGGGDAREVDDRDGRRPRPRTSSPTPISRDSSMPAAKTASDCWPTRRSTPTAIGQWVPWESARRAGRPPPRRDRRARRSAGGGRARANSWTSAGSGPRRPGRGRSPPSRRRSRRAPKGARSPPAIVRSRRVTGGGRSQPAPKAKPMKKTICQAKGLKNQLPLRPGLGRQVQGAEVGAEVEHGAEERGEALVDAGERHEDRHHREDHEVHRQDVEVVRHVGEGEQADEVAPGRLEEMLEVELGDVVALEPPPREQPPSSRR
jgi:hypothetical protein